MEERKQKRVSQQRLHKQEMKIHSLNNQQMKMQISQALALRQTFDKGIGRNGKVKDVENWPTLKQLNNKDTKRNGNFVFVGVVIYIGKGFTIRPF
jgi:hypothetical protein